MTDREAMRLALEALESRYASGSLERCGGAITALRARLKQPQQQAEPVAYLSQAGNFLSPLEFTVGEAALYGWTPVYTSPPQRQWVGLTAEDLAQIESDEFWSTGNHMAIALAVEDKLKEKNT